LDSTDDQIMQHWGRWYISQREPRWLRRNALIVLGNVAASGTAATSDSRVATTLARYLAGDDPMLRAHAVWAARSCGLDHLLPATDPHPDVLAELTAPL
jgi:epoxyqueuosine reductase